MTMEFGKELSITTTPIPGLLVVSLPVHGDARGWFKENWQREKMVALGLPDFHPVQNNISFNETRGTTRGLHAEPWDKYVSVATGSAFGAWVDLRQGDTFGATFTIELNPSTAVFVPRGVANGFQTLEDNVAYAYLVNDHWSADAGASYRMLNLTDSQANIPWPLPHSQWEISEKDAKHPFMDEVIPFEPQRTLVIGKVGQLASALSQVLPAETTDYLDRPEIDLTSDDWSEKVNWSRYDTLINAAAFTAVDPAETDEGRELAWAINASAVAQMARLALSHDLTLIHVSSDYVFDGNHTEPATEDKALSPKSVYGASKAAGDLCVTIAPKHYLVRTSWVVGDGHNFVRTMQKLAQAGKNVQVVADQIGRLTFTQDLALFIAHLLDTQPQYGTYNLTGDGPSASWFEIAQAIYTETTGNADLVSPQSTLEYNQGAGDKLIAPRPAYSVLDLSRTKASGFNPREQFQALHEYLNA